MNKKISKKVLFYLVSLLFFLPAGYLIWAIVDTLQHPSPAILFLPIVFATFAGFLLVSIIFLVLGIRQRSLVETSQVGEMSITHIGKSLNPIALFIIGSILVAFSSFYLAPVLLNTNGFVLFGGLAFSFPYALYFYVGLFGIIFMVTGFIRFFRN